MSKQRLEEVKRQCKTQQDIIVAWLWHFRG
jgi:hypothetical protein